MEVMRQLPQRERSILYKTIRKRAREATSGSKTAAGTPARLPLLLR
jgi:hypothetical protein